eukprot:COSAG03_NODE_1522_length_3938_cov_22.956499_4_plen_64_part_00
MASQCPRGDACRSESALLPSLVRWSAIRTGTPALPPAIKDLLVHSLLSAAVSVAFWLVLPPRE